MNKCHLIGFYAYITGETGVAIQIPFHLYKISKLLIGWRLYILSLFNFLTRWNSHRIYSLLFVPPWCDVRFIEKSWGLIFTFAGKPER